MNIFVLDSNPVLAAQYHGDKHVVKMVTETMQILCDVHWKYLTDFCMHPLCCEPTHEGHPCVRWAAESRQNYSWLLELGYAIADEYHFRYHLPSTALSVFDRIQDATFLPDLGLTDRPRAFGKFQSDHEDIVEAYRHYYREVKGFLTWEKGRDRPFFMQDSYPILS